VNSSVLQTIYVSVYVQKKRQYVQAPCTDGATSTTTPRKYHYTNMPGQAFIWESGQVYYKPYTIAAGATVAVNVELDWNRPNIERNFSVTVWATKQAVKLTEKSGKPSASWYLYNPAI
jgi:hypothetical protein